MKGPGYQTDTGGLRDSADGFRNVHGGVSDAQDSLNQISVPHEAFGVSGPGPRLAAGIEDMIGTTLGEVDDLLGQLDEFIGNVNASADTYDDLESDNGAKLQATYREDRS
ncbi:hypothetical protein EV193_102305 [Herbihabitans rhizosphaerae]|uniref:Excreted virulence factor EspC (Type VII ESX diderm) n=1 Tax=Herbihabitans rhizosphaerae TaxID=1872711 RepID=A0A4Q7L2J5_9PSEU|nr:hypothetical protein [Herbihabitans rhizosphaerae]RZS43326.1 hypothetical protein EV193_102305 [Herbihabitans rhizosphaerae]